MQNSNALEQTARNNERRDISDTKNKLTRTKTTARSGRGSGHRGTEETTAAQSGKQQNGDGWLHFKLRPEKERERARGRNALETDSKQDTIKAWLGRSSEKLSERAHVQ